MTKVKKNPRIITVRNFMHKQSFEAIEIAENGVFLWVSEDWSIYDKFPVCGSFPVTLEFVEEMFEENGRKLDLTKLPKNFVSNPYANWM
jgi:hypothetical protein